ncbi:MAG: hypothetical protein K0B02_04595 [DPANN group archaeon]|nr:hypothetical protein [DPANN group archaeon]
MLVELIAALFITIGIVFIYIMSTKKDENTTKFMTMFFLSIVLTYTGITLFGITWEIFITKIKALILILIGVFFAYNFQGNVSDEYQYEGFAMIGMITGIILLILGLYWLIF